MQGRPSPERGAIRDSISQGSCGLPRHRRVAEANIRRGFREIATGPGHQPPQYAQNEEVVPPVIDVDDDALRDDAEISGVDDVIDRLPRRARKRKRVLMAGVTVQSER